MAAALAGGAVLLAAPWMVLAAIAAIGTGSAAWSAEGSAQQQGQRRLWLESPPAISALYRAAAARYGLDWAVLAGVGKVECDHGRDAEPSCRQPGAVNGAGAGGPMQFLASTWSRYGVDGDHDGRRDRWDPADAIYAAANYLSAAGAPGDYRKALFAYNHASWYVSDVLRWASRYRAAAADRDRGGGRGRSELAPVANLDTCAVHRGIHGSPRAGRRTSRAGPDARCRRPSRP